MLEWNSMVKHTVLSLLRSSFNQTAVGAGGMSAETVYIIRKIIQYNNTYNNTASSFERLTKPRVQIRVLLDFVLIIDYPVLHTLCSGFWLWFGYPFRHNALLIIA